MGNYFENPRHIEFQKAVFTTFVRRSGCLEFWREHQQRLRFSCESYFAKADFSVLEKRIKKLLLHLPKRGDLRIKISIYPKNGVEFVEKYSQLALAMFWSPLPVDMVTEVKAQLLQTATPTYLFNVKTENYSEVFRLLREAQKAKFNEVLFCSQKGELLRASTSNLFAIKDGQMIVPDYRGMEQLEGITIPHMKKALASEFELMTAPIDYALIQSCQGLFLCNCVRGLRPVVQIEKQKLKSKSLLPQLQLLWKDYKYAHLQEEA